jgi:hypothetical protein
VLGEDLLGQPGLEEVRRVAPLAQNGVEEPLAAGLVLLPPASACVDTYEFFLFFGVIILGEGTYRRVEVSWVAGVQTLR